MKLFASVPLTEGPLFKSPSYFKLTVDFHVSVSVLPVVPRVPYPPV